MEGQDANGFQNQDVNSSHEINPDQPSQPGLALGIANPDGVDQFLRYEVNGQATQEQIFSATQGSTLSTECFDIRQNTSWKWSISNE